MNKYIKADEIPALFNEEYKRTRKLIKQGETHLDNLDEGFMEAKQVISRMPAADVVEVVRCKDCKYCEEFTNKSGFCTSERSVLFIVRNTDYCSKGERRTE